MPVKPVNDTTTVKVGIVGQELVGASHFTNDEGAPYHWLVGQDSTKPISMVQGFSH